MAVVVAIDGPAGAGKSTLAARMAEALDLPYVNTGLMYRAVAAAALQQGVSVEDGSALADVSQRLKFALGEGEGRSLLIGGRVPDAELKTDDVEEVVSRVARHPEVRAVLRVEQLRLGAGGAVMEGRDIGSVVFPNAEVKLFLQATAGERATRRALERGEEGEVREALHARDAQDATVNPFTPAPDAILLDTTGLSADEVLHAALRIVRAELGGRA